MREKNKPISWCGGDIATSKNRTLISNKSNTYVINVSNNRHVTDVVDFVHLTTHVVDGKLLGERGRIGQFRGCFRGRFSRSWVTQKCSRRGEEKMQRKMPSPNLEMDIHREVKRVT